jgi:hypothetical protein
MFYKNTREILLPLKNPRYSAFFTRIMQPVKKCHEFSTTRIRFLPNTTGISERRDRCRCFFGSAFGQENAANDREGMNRVVCMTLKILNRNRINQAMNEIFFAVIQEQ